jgi:hypothetical protein
MGAKNRVVWSSVWRLIVRETVRVSDQRRCFLDHVLRNAGRPPDLVMPQAFLPSPIICLTERAPIPELQPDGLLRAVVPATTGQHWSPKRSGLIGDLLRQTRGLLRGQVIPRKQQPVLEGYSRRVKIADRPQRGIQLGIMLSRTQSILRSNLARETAQLTADRVEPALSRHRRLIPRAEKAARR